TRGRLVEVGRHEIQSRERHHLSDFRYYFEPVPAHWHEVAPPEAHRRAAKRPSTKNTLFCRLQKLRIDVGCQQRNPPVLHIWKQFPQNDSQRIGLLARGASGAPQPKLLLTASLRDQLRQSVPHQCVECWSAPHEVRLAHREVAG